MEVESLGCEQGKCYGEKIAQVIDIDDPERLLRAQVRIIDLHSSVPDKDLPWAEFRLPIGAKFNNGTYTPVTKGDWVWVDCPYNYDPRRVRIVGSVHFAPEGVLNLPHETFVGAEAYIHQRTGDEPPQPAHIYGKDSVSTLNGVMIATNEDGSYSIAQKGTGTDLTITKDGDVVLHVEGNIYRSATKDSKGNIDGADKVLIIGKHEVVAMEGIDHDGGSGNPLGNVNGHCLCAYSGKPHPHISSNVKSTL